jgi:hypothetical protein
MQRNRIEESKNRSKEEVIMEGRSEGQTEKKRMSNLISRE